MAVWCFSTKDYCTVLGITVLVATTLINPGLSAPTTKEPRWWVNACNPSQLTHTRHGRSTEENQLNIFIHKINIIIKDLNKIYKSSDFLAKTKQGLRWLRIKKIQKTMESANNTYQGFHNAVQIFAIYTERLMTVKIVTNAKFNKTQRNRMYSNVMHNLRLLLCEFDDMEHPVYDDKKHKLRYPNATMDLSEVQITDSQFLKKMRTFMKRSRRILKKYKNTQKRKNKKKVIISA